MLTVSDINAVMAGNLGNSYVALGGDPKAKFYSKEDFMREYVSLLKKETPNITFYVEDNSTWSDSGCVDDYLDSWNSSSCY